MDSPVATEITYETYSEVPAGADISPSTGDYTPTLYVVILILCLISLILNLITLYNNKKFENK